MYRLTIQKSNGRRIGLALQVFEQPVEGQTVGVVVLPVAEIGDEKLANFTGLVARLSCSIASSTATLGAPS